MVVTSTRSHLVSPQSTGNSPTPTHHSFYPRSKLLHPRGFGHHVGQVSQTDINLRGYLIQTTECNRSIEKCIFLQNRSCAAIISHNK